MTTDPRFDGPGADELYQASLREGVLRLPECEDCHRTHLPPRLVCPHCGSWRLRQIDASGEGEVYSVTVIQRNAEKGGSFNVALIDLAEGPRLMSRIEGIEPDAVRIGMQVQAAVELRDGAPVVIFHPREEGQP